MISGPKTCQHCEGSCVVTRQDRAVYGDGRPFLVIERCPQCEGDGKVVVASFRVGETLIASHVVPARFWPGNTRSEKR